MANDSKLAPQKTKSDPLEKPADSAKTGNPAKGAEGLETVPPGQDLDKAGSPTPEEEEKKKKDAFRARPDLHLKDHIPSTGLGKFDAAYKPDDSKLAIDLNVACEFLDAQDKPDATTLAEMTSKGEYVAKYSWSEADQKDYLDKFKARVIARWSGKHQMKSVKKGWEEFAAKTVVAVTNLPAADKAKAHFALKVHKVSSSNPVYKSKVNNEQLNDKTKQSTADLYETDNTENADFRSKLVAAEERKRLDAAIAAAGAITFTEGTAVLTADATAKLTNLAAEMKKGGANKPKIPIKIKGVAGPKGEQAVYEKLPQQRADVVKAFLLKLAVPQPLTAMGQMLSLAKGVDSALASLTTDKTFETTYASNPYSVSEHEVGHMFGLPDEYVDYATAGKSAGLQKSQTEYKALITSAGLEAPTYGKDTTSQMSAGVDVMPIHGVTFWEALGKMTSPDIQQSEWKLGS